jgi:hypothetical protein
VHADKLTFGSASANGQNGVSQHIQGHDLLLSRVRVNHHARLALQQQPSDSRKTNRGTWACWSGPVPALVSMILISLLPSTLPPDLASPEPAAFASDFRKGKNPRWTTCFSNNEHTSFVLAFNLAVTLAIRFRIASTSRSRLLSVRHFAQTKTALDKDRLNVSVKRQAHVHNRQGRINCVSDKLTGTSGVVSWSNRFRDKTSMSFSQGGHRSRLCVLRSPFLQIVMLECLWMKTNCSGDGIKNDTECEWLL